MVKKHVTIWIVVAVLLASAGCPTNGQPGGGDGPGGITPVLGWIVSFAKATGEWISEKATLFADAVERAWKAFWGPEKVGNVLVNGDDPLKGIYDGKLKCRVEWGAEGRDPRKSRLEIELDRPEMIRESADSKAWELAPKEKERIKELQEQLLRPV